MTSSRGLAKMSSDIFRYLQDAFKMYCEDG